MPEQDPRIGTLTPDGKPATWPGVDVTGARYGKPATRHKLNKTHFVVLPAGFNQWSLLSELKASLAPVAVAPVVEVVPEVMPDEAAADVSAPTGRRNR